MPAVDETIENQNSTRRLTFRQKFWLLGVGLPVLLLVVLLVLAVFLPRPLNSTERKLLGKWEIVDPPSSGGTIVEFRSGHVISSQTGAPAYWTADETSLTVDELEDWHLWTRLKARFGFPVDSVRYEICHLDEQEMQLGFGGAGNPPITLKRVQPIQH